jgi:hypothetical protein
MRFFILGTGACGFINIWRMLAPENKIIYKLPDRKYQNSFGCRSEKTPKWDTQKSSKRHRRQIVKELSSENRIMPVVIRYVREILKTYPEAHIICLKAEKSETVSNLVWSWGYTNPLIFRPRIHGREYSRYDLDQFPYFSDLTDPFEACSRYYDEYYTLAESLRAEFPQNFFILNSNEDLHPHLNKLPIKITELPKKRDLPKETFTTNLNGGIGNCLFQIAEALSFAEEYGYPEPKFGYWQGGDDYKFPPYYEADQPFGGHNVDLSDFESKFPNLKFSAQLDIDSKTHFSVNNMFRFSEIKNYLFIQKKLEIANRLNWDTVSLHLRFGKQSADISRVPKLRDDYYHKALKAIPSESTIFVYSDNLSEAAQWIIRWQRLTNHTFILRDTSAVETLREMASCNFHILHSSTLSFWGAYLDGKQPKRNVIYPKEFEELHGRRMIPFEHWLRL